MLALPTYVNRAMAQKGYNNYTYTEKILVFWYAFAAYYFALFLYLFFHSESRYLNDRRSQEIGIIDSNRLYVDTYPDFNNHSRRIYNNELRQNLNHNNELFERNQSGLAKNTELEE